MYSTSHFHISGYKKKTRYTVFFPNVLCTVLYIHKKKLPSSVNRKWVSLAPERLLFILQCGVQFFFQFMEIPIFSNLRCKSQLLHDIVSIFLAITYLRGLQYSNQMEPKGEY